MSQFLTVDVEIVQEFREIIAGFIPESVVINFAKLD